jgi:DNA-binding CsgD family transcriptional regulator
VLGGTGDYAEQLAIAKQGLARTEGDVGDRSWSPMLHAYAGGALIALGRWDEASDELAAGRWVQRMLPDELELTLRVARLAVLRGDDEAVAQIVRRARPRLGRLTVSEPQIGHLAGAVSAEWALASGDPAGAWHAVEWLLSPGLVACPSYDVEVFALAAVALAALRRSGAAPEPDPGASLVAGFAVCDTWPPADAWRALIEAELGGATGERVGVQDPADALVRWRRAAHGAEDGRIPVAWRLHVELGLAQAEAAAGERDAARARVGGVADRARRLGAVPLLRSAEELASRLGVAAAPEAEPGVLTAREREVLDLVAAGLSNGEIGKRLFITTKTASVHVSAILRKLGVASRTEAAVIAATVTAAATSAPVR